MAETVRQNERKVRQGTVVSDKMNKSIVVRVDRTMRHRLYMKIFRTSSKLYAHDEIVIEEGTGVVEVRADAPDAGREMDDDVGGGRVEHPPDVIEPPEIDMIDRVAAYLDPPFRQ